MITGVINMQTKDTFFFGLNYQLKIKRKERPRKHMPKITHRVGSRLPTFSPSGAMYFTVCVETNHTPPHWNDTNLGVNLFHLS